MLTAVKETEDGKGLLVHYYESAGKASEVHLRLPVGATSAVELNLREKPQGAPLPILHGNEAALRISPFQIQTVRLNAAGTPATSAQATSK